MTVDLTQKDVLCSAGKGRMTARECLDCALANGTPPCQFDYGLLLSMLSDEPRPDIHVTDLTGCLRKAWFTKMDPQPEYVHDMLARTVGTFFHAEAEAEDTHTWSELKLDVDGVVGRADRVYKNGRVVDYKTARFLYMNLLPYNSHGVQLNIYAHMLRKMGYEVNELAIQYICLSGPTKCSKHRKAVVWADGELICPRVRQSPQERPPGRCDDRNSAHVREGNR